MTEVDAGRRFDRDQVLAMERAAARAWPPQATADVDGWVWRCSGGGSRRANSVLPLAYSASDLDTAIGRIEDLYRAQGLRSYFQVSSIAEPPDLDAQLERRGYTYEEPVLLMAKALDRRLLHALSGVDVTTAPTADWLAIYCATVDAARRTAVPKLLAQVPDKRGFFVVRRDGVALATALCVISPDGVAIVECVATDPARRRNGAARQVMDALEAWAAHHGAGIAALQVVENNTAARALYDARGYAHAGHYHYRWRQV